MRGPGLAEQLRPTHHGDRPDDGEHRADPDEHEQHPPRQVPRPDEHVQLVDRRHLVAELPAAEQEPAELAQVLDARLGTEREELDDLVHERRRGRETGGGEHARQPGAHALPDARTGRVEQHGDGERRYGQQGDELGLDGEADEQPRKPRPAVQHHERRGEQPGRGHLAEHVDGRLDR